MHYIYYQGARVLGNSVQFIDDASSSDGSDADRLAHTHTLTRARAHTQRSSSSSSAGSDADRLAHHTRTHALKRAHTHTHSHKHARTHARTHAHRHTRARTHIRVGASQ